MKKVILFPFILFISFCVYSQKQYEFKTPVNKIDSIDINLRYTKLCINEYRKQVNDSYFYVLSGALATTAGVGINFNNSSETKLNEINYVLIGLGGITFVAGIINYFDASKWLKRAGIEPVLTPNGAYVYVKF